MMDLSTIRQLQLDAAKLARRSKKKPFVAWPGDTYNEIVARGGIPNFGNYRPKGWKLIDTHFVDKSGFGSDREPALTLDKFLSSLVPEHGYAMIEEGQFQCVVGEFEKI